MYRRAQTCAVSSYTVLNETGKVSHVLRNNEARSRNIVAVEKLCVLHICLRVSARVGACVQGGCPSAGACACERARVALLIQHATRMCHIVRNLWALWLHYIFRHFLINGTIFGQNVIEHKICVSIFSAAFI